MPFARIGSFDVSPNKLTSVVELFRDWITPAFASLNGFLGYQAFVDEVTGRYIGISYWASQAALEDSTDTAHRARCEAEALGAQIIGEPISCRQQFDTRSASPPAASLSSSPS